jgi:hypothetical protein
VEKGRLRAFFKKKVCLKSWRIDQFEQKPVKDNDRTANGTLSLAGRHI